MNKTTQKIKRMLALGVVVTIIINTVIAATSVNAANIIISANSKIVTDNTALSANNKIEAENYDYINIATVENNTKPPSPYEDTEGATRKLVNTKIGSYASYNNIDFSSGTSVFTARYSAKGSDASGTIEVWLDCNINNDLTLSGGNLVTTLSTSDTDLINGFTYRTAYNNLITPISGVHNVYLIFKPDNNKKYTCDLNWFYFSKELSDIRVDSSTKIDYSIGESFHSYEDVTIRATYMDGTSGYEYIGREDVTGYNSLEQRIGEKLTVSIRNVTTDYMVNINNELLSIEKPKELTGIKNGTQKKVKELGLPERVKISTISGIQEAEVEWNMPSTEYDPNVKAAQNFTIIGSVILPLLCDG